MIKKCILCFKDFNTSLSLSNGSRIQCRKRVRCWDCLPINNNFANGIKNTRAKDKKSILYKKCRACNLYNMDNDLDYCSKCALKIKNKQEKTSICSYCKISYVKTKHSSKYILFPNLCMLCIENNYSALVKKRCIDYLGSKCIRCGFNKCIWGLEFHHRIPDTKLFAISTGYEYPWRRLKNELDKCDLLCANCHREQHFNLNKDIIDYLNNIEFKDVLI